MTMPSVSRYADISEIPCSHKVIDDLNLLASKYSLTDHASLNRSRFPWSEGLLTPPEIYASRLWEYPWAILNAHVKTGMKCADIGCGESVLTIYLKEIAGCEVTGFDRDLHNNRNKDNFGASNDYITRTGLDIRHSTIDNLAAADNSFDRVFCISVIEHVSDFKIRSKGMREISRILKPGGLALITVDVNILSRICNPLELIWESGLALHGEIDLRLPEHRFGIFYDGIQPADVFGFVLTKPSHKVQTEYGDTKSMVDAWKITGLRDTFLYYNFENLLRNDLTRFNSNDKPGFLTRLLIALKFLINSYRL